MIHTIPHLLLGDHHNHEEHSTGSHTEISGAVIHEAEHEHDHYNMIYIGVLVLLGFIIFFIAEKSASTHMHSHSSDDVSEVDSIEEEKKEIMIPEFQSDHTCKELKRRLVSGHSHSHAKGEDKGGIDMNGKDKIIVKNTGTLYFFPSFSKLSPSGWLNLLADSMHNFTDGIALGKFSQS